MSSVKKENEGETGRKTAKTTTPTQKRLGPDS